MKLSARHTAKAAFFVVVALLASALQCYSGALAAAGEPSPASAVVTPGEGAIIVIGVGLITFLAKLVKSLGEIKSAGRSFVREEMTLAAADAKKDAMPQPLVTTRHDAPVGKREFDQLRDHVNGHAQKTEDGLRELRDADNHNAEKLAAEMQKLALIIGELRGEVAALTRRK